MCILDLFKSHKTKHKKGPTIAMDEKAVNEEVMVRRSTESVIVQVKEKSSEPVFSRGNSAYDVTELNEATTMRKSHAI